MATITTIIASIIASLSGIPMALESGITFPIGNWSPAEATRIFMENSPFYISMTSHGGIQLTNSKGQWITRTSPIVDADAFSNGYCYFVTESGHKYQFTVMEEKPSNPSNTNKGFTAYIAAKKSMWGKYDRDSMYISVDGVRYRTPSKYFSGDCYYDPFYKAKWYKTPEEVPAGFDAVKVYILWKENEYGKKYPEINLV